MRFGLIHRIMTDALAALGLLALVTSGELNRWMSLTIIAGLVAALLIPERWQDRAILRQIAVTAPIALLVTQVGRLVAGGPLLSLAVEFAAGLQVVRLATRRGAAHDQQVIVLGLLHLIAGTVLGGGLAYGMCFVGFLIVAPGALVLSHLRREVEGNYRQGARDRTGLPVDVPRILRSRRVIGRPFLIATCLLSVPIFLFTAILFVMFPRVGLSLLLLNHSNPTRVVGFSDHVDLGGVGKLRADPTIAMRVQYPDLKEPPARIALYLRGTAFDTYDGRAWKRTKAPHVRTPQSGDLVRLRRYPDPARDKKLIIDLEPIEPPVLFIPPNAVGLRLGAQTAPLLGRQAKITSGGEDELRYDSPDERGLRYEVFLAGADDEPSGQLPPAVRDRYLRLPPSLTERVRNLASRWVGAEDSPYEQAKIIESRLRTHYTYDLDSPSGAQADPLDHFLFESKRGHCEFYSTAMAVMLRSLGVPSRNATGFIGGTYNSFGNFYAVRQGDAHSWVEAYFPGHGWTRFDPTPPASAAPQSEITGLFAFLRDVIEASAQRWNHHVVGYNLRQQVDLLRSVRDRYNRLQMASEWRAVVSPRRAIPLLLGLALVAIAVHRLLRRRKSAAPDVKQARRMRIQNDQIIDLYKSLEAALAVRGAPRHAGTPPLAHARALAHMGHPVGAEALALTELYISVRFGGRPLPEADKKDFARRVRLLRHGKDRNEPLAA